jgi:hypothetical protein
MLEVNMKANTAPIATPIRKVRFQRNMSI